MTAEPLRESFFIFSFENRKKTPTNKLATLPLHVLVSGKHQNFGKKNSQKQTEKLLPHCTSYITIKNTHCGVECW